MHVVNAVSKTLRHDAVEVHLLRLGRRICILWQTFCCKSTEFVVEYSECYWQCHCVAVSVTGGVIVLQ